MEANHDPADGGAITPPRIFETVLDHHQRRSSSCDLEATSEAPKAQVIAEPVGRNTAPAIGLAAFLLLRENPDAVIGMFPSDHVIADEEKLSHDHPSVARRLRRRAKTSLFSASVRTEPKPDTDTLKPGSIFNGDALRVRRFTEKPNAETAAAFVAAGNYFWNSGMFLWSARTLANALR